MDRPDHRRVYEASAADWHEGRRGSYPERPWIDRLVEGLDPGARVLDLGCGSGHPVAADLLARGFRVTGVDFAPAMLAIARRTLPGGDWIEADIRSYRPGPGLSAAIGWDSLFHLAAAEQRAVLPRLCAALEPGGRLLFTSGPAAGEAWGRVSGGPVWHESLSPAGYAALLEDAGMAIRRFVAEDRETAGHTVWLARRVGK